MKIPFLSFTCEDIGVAMVTNMIISKMNKKSCVLCRNFVSIYIINRTFHSRLGIQILSSRAKSISHSFASLTRERYFQHSKIKFVSPRGHEISSIYENMLKYKKRMESKSNNTQQLFWVVQQDAK